MATICLAPSRTRKTLYISGPFSSGALVAPSQFPKSIAALLTKSLWATYALTPFALTVWRREPYGMPEKQWCR